MKSFPINQLYLCDFFFSLDISATMQLLFMVWEIENQWYNYSKFQSVVLYTQLRLLYFPSSKTPELKRCFLDSQEKTPQITADQEFRSIFHQLKSLIQTLEDRDAKSVDILPLTKSMGWTNADMRIARDFWVFDSLIFSASILRWSARSLRRFVRFSSKHSLARTTPT